MAGGVAILLVVIVLLVVGAIALALFGTGALGGSHEQQRH
jgi:flagellar basal body-associated protein FliL